MIHQATATDNQSLVILVAHPAILLSWYYGCTYGLLSISASCSFLYISNRCSELYTAIQSFTSLRYSPQRKGAHSPSSLMHSAKAPTCKSHIFNASCLNSVRNSCSAYRRNDSLPSRPSSFTRPASRGGDDVAVVLLLEDDDDIVFL
jgi:hypothetical protein